MNEECFCDLTLSMRSVYGRLRRSTA